MGWPVSGVLSQTQSYGRAPSGLCSSLSQNQQVAAGGIRCRSQAITSRWRKMTDDERMYAVHMCREGDGTPLTAWKRRCNRWHKCCKAAEPPHMCGCKAVRSNVCARACHTLQTMRLQATGEGRHTNQLLIPVQAQSKPGIAQGLQSTAVVPCTLE